MRGLYSLLQANQPPYQTRGKTFLYHLLNQPHMNYEIQGRNDRMFTVGKSLVELTSEAASSLFRKNHLELVGSVRIAGYGFPVFGGAERIFRNRIRTAAQEFDATYVLAKSIIAAGWKRDLDDYISAVVDFYKSK